MDQKQLFVVGAGVVGLTTAIRALEAGYKVTVFAEIFPTDPKSIKYTSFWAGANHLSFAESGALMEVLEKDTLNEFLDLIKQDPLVPAMTRTHFGLYETLSGAQERLDHFSQFYPDFRSLDASECPAGVVGDVVAGHSWTTICIDVPRYLLYLLERFFKLGGQAFRTTIPSLSSLVSANGRPSMEVFGLNSSSGPQTPTMNPVAVINCTGLGAFSLQDVLDTDVYPTSGQTIIIRAPWVQPSIIYYFANSDISYIIPRQSGDIVLGGSWGVDDWHATSRPEIAKAIKERGVRIYPELLPPGKREKGDINDLDVVAECVGLRTSRKTGVRLETTVLEVDGKKIPVIHNYGHGGGGYQSSWGSAKHVMKLLGELD